MSFKNQVALYAITLELFRMKNLLRGKIRLRMLVSSFYFYGGRIQVECGNRPDCEGKRKTKKDEADESVVLSEKLELDNDFVPSMQVQSCSQKQRRNYC